MTARAEWWELNQASLEDISASSIWEDVGAVLRFEIGPEGVSLSIRFYDQEIIARQDDLVLVHYLVACTWIGVFSRTHPKRSQVCMRNNAAAYLAKMSRHF